jgi:hypothetical protein
MLNDFMHGDCYIPSNTVDSRSIPVKSTVKSGARSVQITREKQRSEHTSHVRLRKHNNQTDRKRQYQPIPRCPNHTPFAEKHVEKNKQKVSGDPKYKKRNIKNAKRSRSKIPSRRHKKQKKPSDSQVHSSYTILHPRPRIYIHGKGGSSM